MTDEIVTEALRRLAVHGTPRGFAAVYDEAEAEAAGDAADDGGPVVGGTTGARNGVWLAVAAVAVVVLGAGAVQLARSNGGPAIEVGSSSAASGVSTSPKKAVTTTAVTVTSAPAPCELAAGCALPAKPTAFTTARLPKGFGPTSRLDARIAQDEVVTLRQGYESATADIPLPGGKGKRFIEIDVVQYASAPPAFVVNNPEFHDTTVGKRPARAAQRQLPAGVYQSWVTVVVGTTVVQGSAIGASEADLRAVVGSVVIR